MKYCTMNNLQEYEFHDAKFTWNDFHDGVLSVTVDFLNIHRFTKENPDDEDMELDAATVTFYGLSVESLAFSRSITIDENGKAIIQEPPIYQGKEIEEVFFKQLKESVFIYYAEIQKSGSKTVLELDAHKSDAFHVVLSFDSVTVEWDSYRKKAWYELHKQYSYPITLQTPNGPQKTQVQIYSNEENEYHLSITVRLVYNGVEFYGHGTNYDWVDAFVDLQKRLPDGVTITCCLTCLHGNMCPVGNQLNEVFCTKDVTITAENMDTLFFCTENEAEREKRSREYTFLCDDYRPQDPRFFTYNDYYLLLNK